MSHSKQETGDRDWESSRGQVMIMWPYMHKPNEPEEHTNLFLIKITTLETKKRVMQHFM